MIDVNGTWISGHRITAITKVCVKKVTQYEEKTIHFICDSVPMEIAVRHYFGTESSGGLTGERYVQDTHISQGFQRDDITKAEYDNFEEKCKLLYELRQF